MKRWAGWVMLAVVSALGGLWFRAHAQYAIDLGPRADVARRWVECRYVRAGVDPYSLARRLLAEEVGPSDAATVRLFRIPDSTRTETQALLLPDLGPPESTYPPSAVGVQLALLGWLPTSEAAVRWWLAVELASIAGIVWLLSGWMAAPGGLSRPANAAAILTLVLLFYPFASAVRSAQLSTVCLFALMVGCRRDFPWWVAGLALAVGVAKPTIGLPFVAWAVCRGQWRAVAVATGTHLLLGSVVCAAIGSGLMDTHRDWMAITPYFMAGTYSVQDVITVLKGHGTPLASAVQLAGLGLIGLVCLAGRRAGWAAGMGFLGVANLLWIYHRDYDFVTLLVPALSALGWRAARPDDGRASVPEVQGWAGRAVGAVAVVMIGLGLLPSVVTGDDGLDRMIRWGCRATLAGGVVVTAWRMVRDGRRVAACVDR